MYKMDTTLLNWKRKNQMAKLVCPICGKELEAQPGKFGDIQVIPCSTCYNEKTIYDRKLVDRGY